MTSSIAFLALLLAVGGVQSSSVYSADSHMRELYFKAANVDDFIKVSKNNTPHLNASFHEGIVPLVSDLTFKLREPTRELAEGPLIQFQYNMSLYNPCDVVSFTTNVEHTYGLVLERVQNVTVKFFNEVSDVFGNGTNIAEEFQKIQDYLFYTCLRWNVRGQKRVECIKKAQQDAKEALNKFNNEVTLMRSKSENVIKSQQSFSHSLNDKSAVYDNLLNCIDRRVIGYPKEFENKLFAAYVQLFQNATETFVTKVASEFQSMKKKTNQRIAEFNAQLNELAEQLNKNVNSFVSRNYHE